MVVAVCFCTCLLAAGPALAGGSKLTATGTLGLLPGGGEYPFGLAAGDTFSLSVKLGKKDQDASSSTGTFKIRSLKAEIAGLRLRSKGATTSQLSIGQGLDDALLLRLSSFGPLRGKLKGEKLTLDTTTALPTLLRASGQFAGMDPNQIPKNLTLADLDDAFFGSFSLSSGRDGTQIVSDLDDLRFGKRRSRRLTETSTGSAVPEPGTATLLGLGLAVMAARARHAALSRSSA